ncbi:hypothetical protein KKF92_03580 [Patescibacteria group bacterium]|nr:hypothetical protein [Patescibacteria group bacterium]
MPYQHADLAAGRWQSLSLVEQMANIGSEVERTISWRKKNKLDYSQRAFFRALELIDLTILFNHQASILKEVCRLRENLVDSFFANNTFGTTDEAWQNYFKAFNWAARDQHSKKN